jgi:hypothetical protein
MAPQRMALQHKGVFFCAVNAHSHAFHDTLSFEKHEIYFGYLKRPDTQMPAYSEQTSTACVDFVYSIALYL